ncbi:Dihydroorotate dehydrogenase B (NAD(+)), electron transfer subunit [Planctomycetes bacterium MalM25]|nr:Dihydroorotate dehydrogenase B (NAD(+)), electron transfer subunit [Planctomycetes bacterium MalM25]
MDCQLDQTPLHAKHYADGSSFVAAPIVENVRIADATYRLRFEAPDLARRITPGQFVMVRLAGIDDPLLGRAFAMYDLSEDRTAVDVVYLVHGKLTTALATRQPGDRVEVWGPLGNGFEGGGAGPDGDGPDDDGLDHLILVAGGVGQTPFLACGREALGGAVYGQEDEAVGGVSARTPLQAKRVTLCYGVRNAGRLAGADDFRSAGIDLRVASDDGSIGHHGLVTDLLRQTLDETAGASRKVATCGPEPMMQAVAEMAAAAGVACDASLETPMACGLGICFSCVAKVVQPDGEWDYKRTCVEGPVFDATKLVW